MARSPRIAALAALFLMTFPPVAQELVGLDLGARAAPTPVTSLLPNGVAWQDWTTNNVLHVHQHDPTTCPTDPTTQQVSTPGDKACPLFVNTTQVPANAVPDTTTTRAVVQGTGGLPVSVPDTSKVFARLEPFLAQPLTISQLSATMWVTLDGQVLACGADPTPTGQNSRVNLQIVVRAIATDNDEGSVIATGERDGICAAGTGLTPGTPPYRLDLGTSDFHFTNGAQPQLPQGQKLRLDIVVGVPQGSTINAWSLSYDGTSGDSVVNVGSPDALQYAVWTTDANDERRLTTVFPIPQDTATRFSTEGWFAVKDAWGAYDLPPIEDVNNPQPTDAKWQMSITAPNGKPVVLRDPAVVPNGHEFRKCDSSVDAPDNDDTVTCLTKATNTDDNSAVVYRMPTRPGSGTTPGVSNVWNYTRARMAQVAPCPNDAQQACGGQFVLKLSGRVRDNDISTVVKDSVKFTVGGFGLRMAPWSLPNGVAEQTVHTVVPNPTGPTRTTFLLDVTNLASTADNFTLASSLPSASPQQGWSVEFGGKPVIGQSSAFLQGGNHSVLKVTVTAPQGATTGSATVRVTATSVSAPDQKSQVDLSVQLSSTLTHGVSVFVGPEPAFKTLTRSGNAVFNYTVWNRGTETDTFSVGCVAGPDMTFDPVTRQRHRPEWNGTLAGPGGSILCVDPNGTRLLTLTLGPGDAGDVTATIEHNANDTSQYHMQVKVQAKSQKDADKSDIGTADAQVVALSSFKLRILTDGLANSDDPTSDHAALVLRYGKDDPSLCPNPGTHASCTETTANETTLPGDWKSTPVQQQRVDASFTEYAFYRIAIVNDGDVAATFTPNITRVQNTVLRSGDCGTADLSSFDAATMSLQGTGMGDNTGPFHKANRLLLRPVRDPRPDADTVGGFPLQPGQTAVFYLRVHNEWNRYNISVLEAGTTVGSTTGNICDSRSVVEVTVSSSEEPRPTHTVVATTTAVNVDPLSGTDVLPKNVVVTDGARDPTSAAPSILATDNPQSCPPVTLEGSADRLLCRYVRPGENTTWSFTVTKVNPVDDVLVIGSLQRVGGLSLTDLRNRGWIIPDAPTVDAGDNPPGGSGLFLTGDEMRVHVTIGVPANATVSDFAGLQFSASTRLGAGGATGRPISFYTVGAQKFAVKLKVLAEDPVVIHPGDRAVVNLNISNEGAAPDVYNFSYVGNGLVDSAGQQWAPPTFEPNETRISPSHNKTVSVLLQSPRAQNVVADLPPQTVEVHSVLNTSRDRGATFAQGTFNVHVVPHQPDDVTLTVDGLELRPIEPGGSVQFVLNLTNPSPSAIKVRVHRTPDALATLVDGWRESLPEACVQLNGRESKPVYFTVAAAADAQQDTQVTYVLRADLADNDCNVKAGNTNFAQALARVQVIGKAGLDLQALEPVKVVPRGGSVAFPVRVRNFGTAADSFFFNPQFVNQSQPLPPNPWTVDVRTAEGQAVQNLTVDPGFSRIVFVNLSAPVNIPQLGVRSDLNFGATGAGSGVTASVPLTAFVQDYDLRVRIPNSTVDAIPGQTLFFTLNMTNAGNGLDTFDIQMDVGGLAGFWNVSSEFSAVTLLNGTSRDVQLTVQVPKSPLPTTGAVIGVTVRSRQAESIRPQAEALGLGSPIVALLNSVPKSSLVQVNLYPYVSADVDGDREPELAIDRNRNAQDGYEFFFDPFCAIICSVDVLAADGNGDGKIDHFLDINGDGKPDRYWDPFNGVLTTINAWPDTNNDGTLEFLYDSTGSLAVDRWIDPATHQSGTVIQKDFDDDGTPDYLIDTNGDGRPDKYFDPDKGPRGLVTTVQASSGNPQLFLIDTTGAGRPTKQYDRVTGEVADARISGVLEFVSNFWYLVLLFLAVAGVAGYLVVQRRRQEKPPPE